MPSTKQTLRLRVFAGPNGSGKSTVIEAVKNHKVKGIPVDFGIYVNADDIAKALLKNRFILTRYKIKTTKAEFTEIAANSGLINKEFSEEKFASAFSFTGNRIILRDVKYGDQLAQIIADFLRKKLLMERKKFSFETVFSHESKLDIMRKAIEAGYKVYLYFVCTESPEINKFRIKQVRVKEKGHDVPEEKIAPRYYRSLDLMFDAAQLAYQAYFFDNSSDVKNFKPVAHFKQVNGKKKWDKIDPSIVPTWFIKYYSDKVKK